MGMTRHRNLPLLLLHVREAAMMHFRPILNHYGLTDQQWRVLRVLGEEPLGMEPGQIGSVCQILRPSLSGILARLDSMGLISRQGSATDQRRQIVRLTDHGLERVGRVQPLVDEQYRRIEAALGPAHLDELYRTLDAALDALGEPIESVLARTDESAVAKSAQGARGARLGH